MNCSKRVYTGNSYSGSPCSRKGTVERDGKHYCKQHDPEAVKARQAASRAKWEAEWAAKQRKWAAEAEQKRRADCFDDLLAVAKLALYVAGGGYVGNGSRKEYDAKLAEAARAAIDKARTRGDEG